MPSNRPRNTKTPPPKPEETPPAPPEAKPIKPRPDALLNPQEPYPRAWKDRWLNVAADAMDMAEACANAETTITDYLLARAGDPEFDAACLIFDQIMELRIVDTVRRQAADGTVPAQGVYYKSVRRPSFRPPFRSWYEEPEPVVPEPEIPMPAQVADAMIKAGLEEFERMNRASELSASPPAELHQLPGPAARG